MLAARDAATVHTSTALLTITCGERDGTAEGPPETVAGLNRAADQTGSLHAYRTGLARVALVGLGFHVAMLTMLPRRR